MTIAGPLNEPELRLASTPPLDQSDILSLIVFNTSVNQLTAAQQQELAVRAGTLAAGFLATPMISALERSLGLDILEIEPAGDFGTGPKVTIGDEIAPGLVARFSRQFGQDEYDEATIEYLPVPAAANPGDVLRRGRPALAVQARRTGGNRPVAVFQLLAIRCERDHGVHHSHVPRDIPPSACLEHSSAAYCRAVMTPRSVRPCATVTSRSSFSTSAYTVSRYVPGTTPSIAKAPSCAASAVYGVPVATTTAAMPGWMSQPTL